MKFRYDEGEYRDVVGASETHLVLIDTAGDEVQYNLRNDSLSLETDLPYLYKKDKAGRWQTMKFFLQLDSGPCIRKDIITEGDIKDKQYVSPIAEVGSKLYSTVVQERLQSAWNKKKNRDGWVIDKDVVVLGEPLLLHHWDQYKHLMTYPALIGPKRNGIRATFKPVVGLMSRKRNPFHVKHLIDQLDILGMTVDGELWHPEWTFEQIVSAVKGGVDPGRELEFHLFDRPQGGQYIDRMANLMKILQDKYLPNIKVVPLAIVTTEEEAEAMFEILKDQPGNDGAVIRKMDYMYEFDIRSKEVLKMKDLLMEEFEIVAVMSDADAMGPLIKFEFTGPKGTFLYSPAWTKNKRHEEYGKWSDGTKEYIGTVWTLTFREYTTKGLPKHVMDLTERNYE